MVVEEQRQAEELQQQVKFLENARSRKFLSPEMIKEVENNVAMLKVELEEAEPLFRRIFNIEEQKAALEKKLEAPTAVVPPGDPGNPGNQGRT